MGNKKKRATETELAQSQSSNASVGSANSGIATVGMNNQSCYPVEVKEEHCSKEEPQSVGEMMDVPALNRHSFVPSSLGVDQFIGDYDFDSLNCGDIKIEAKEEVDKKEEKSSKPNANLGENGIGSQHDVHQRALPHQEDNSPSTGSSHGMRYTGICNKVGEPKNVTRKHKCNVCEYATNRSNDLKKHLVKHTGVKPHACSFCLKRFTMKQSLLVHMKVHVEEFLFCCSSCLQVFDLEEEKNKHGTSCKIRRYECHFCEESFGPNKANMIRHTHMHSGNKPFECKECFKQFTRKDNLNNHMKLHAGPRTFRCSNCRLLFSQEEERNTHEEKCNRPKLECDTCGKSFGLKKSNLINHMRTHSGDTPFECQHCLKQFKHKSSLDRHMATHTKKLPFKCLVCRRGFSKKTQWKSHERNCNRRSYECHVCKKFIGSFKRNMERHMRNHSGDKPYQCQLCQNRFSRNSILTEHMNRIHNKNR